MYGTSLFSSSQMQQECLWGLPTHSTTFFKQISESLPNNKESKIESNDCATIRFNSLFEYPDGFLYCTADVTEDKSVQAVCLHPSSGKGTVIHFQNYVAIAEAIESYTNI
jgi:hypothetical protein